MAVWIDLEERGVVCLPDHITASRMGQRMVDGLALLDADLLLLLSARGALMGEFANAGWWCPADD